MWWSIFELNDSISHRWTRSLSLSLSPTPSPFVRLQVYISENRVALNEINWNWVPFEMQLNFLTRHRWNSFALVMWICVSTRNEHHGIFAFSTRIRKLWNYTPGASSVLQLHDFHTVTSDDFQLLAPKIYISYGKIKVEGNILRNFHH